jgi:nitric oxide reductase subunit C
MSTKNKRVLFWFLAAMFVINSYIVYTSGTEADRGKNYMTAEAAAGKLLFQKYNCTACHQLYGLGGYMGPDLTNVISAPGKGPLYAKALIQSGSQRMPNFQMSESEINSLVAFLQYADKTGVSPVRDFEIGYDGTVALKGH